MAETAGLPLWRLRALHELGTLDLFDHAGTQKLMTARDLAVELGALGLCTVLDIQLSAAYLFRFDAQLARHHAERGERQAAALGQDQLRATALAFSSEAAGLLGDTDGLERYGAAAIATAPADPEIEGSIRGGRGLAALLAGDRDRARAELARAAELLDPLPNAGPGLYRGFWLLLRAVERIPGPPPIETARRSGITVNRANRTLARLAAAVEAGRVETSPSAVDRVEIETDRELAPFGLWSDLARMLVSEAALADGWGQPVSWLDRSADAFAAAGFVSLAAHCADLRNPRPTTRAALGISRREGEVFALVSTGLTNREIAGRLSLSHRTVEKHVESLLRKTGCRSRTQLARIDLDT